ncbi:MAG: FAD/NAD(P)-binding protein [Eubacteriales bacterium]
MDKRAIIIGTGLAGLIAGAYLSRDGFSVELFEQRDEIGGVTSGYRKNGYYLRTLDSSTSRVSARASRPDAQSTNSG